MPPRPPKGSSISANQHAYIPQGAQAALARQMQQAVPAHLKQYVNNPSGYVPPRVQQELTTYMEAALPQHLQQYAGAYVEQNVVMPSMMQRPGAGQASTFRPPKTINPRNLSHSGSVGSEQADATTMLGLFQPDHQRPSGSPAAPSATTPQAAASNPQPTTSELPPAPQYPSGQLTQPVNSELPKPPLDQSHYDFIMNPPTSSRPAGSGSLGKRVGLVAGFGVLLIIVVIVVSSLIGGGQTAKTQLVTVAQEQAELLRVAGLAQTNRPSPASAQLANYTTINMLSAQAQLLKYLNQHKVKIGPKLLALKHSAQTDTTLKAAAANSNFDSVFQQTIQQDIVNYSTALKSAYNANPGPKGQALLKNEYAGATLLLQQVKQSQSATN